MRRTITAAMLGILLAACGGEEAAEMDGAAEAADAAGDMAMDDEAERQIEGGGELAGWHGRTDQDAPFDNVLVTDQGDGMYQVDNGPAVVLWQDGTRAEGNYTLTGTFHQVSSKGHPHGTGIVFGGADMDAPGQVYTYFMVRGSGDFLVKTRTGEETFWVAPTDGWVANAAINADDANGEYTNELSVQVMADEIAYMINGTEVLRTPREGTYADGYYGVRMNHNLTIQFSGLAMTAGM